MGGHLSSSGCERVLYGRLECSAGNDFMARLAFAASCHQHCHHPTKKLQEQQSKSRIKGIDAVRASIQAAKSVSRILRSSLGPKGMDKMLQSPDGDVTVSECCDWQAERWQVSSAFELARDQFNGLLGQGSRWLQQLAT
jgi:hypothetical protein